MNENTKGAGEETLASGAADGVVKPEARRHRTCWSLKVKVNPEYAHLILADAGDRERQAARFCRVLSGANTREGVPYRPNESDSYFWSIDPAGNDYWVRFSEEDNLVYSIKCRYAGKQAEILEALVRYLAARWRCEILPEEE